MKEKKNKNLALIILALILILAIFNLNFLITLLKKGFSLLFPLVFGLLLALILNSPMRGFEKLFDKCFSKSKKVVSIKVKYSICLILSILSIFLALLLVVTLAIPKIVDSFNNLFEFIKPKFPDLLIFLEKYGIDTTEITDKLQDYDAEEVIKNTIRGALSLVSTTVDATKTFINILGNIVISLIISIYLLLDKNNISRHFKKLIYAYITKEKADYIYRTSYLVRDTFSKFLTGQCLESVILAVLIFSAFSIFGLPYSSLIAVMSAVLSFIPYIGTFTACFVGVGLTVISEPRKALLCLGVFLFVQLIEQHLIYPHVVGSSVGLSPFYTVIAVLLGGKLFGILGMIFFIPLFSVIYTVIKELITQKEDKSKIIFAEKQ